jgi:glycosyltransferase involved in cell wall biosynthesis
VTNPDPKVLRQELEKLAASPEELHRLSSAARDAASSDFSPEKIQAQFLNALRDTLTLV